MYTFSHDKEGVNGIIATLSVYATEALNNTNTLYCAFEDNDSNNHSKNATLLIIAGK